MVTSSISKQFSDPLLVTAYDALNALGDDSIFWLKEIKKLAPQSIIDLGCGTGLLTCELAKQGYHVIGVEPAEKMLAIARKKPYADKVQWVQGSYEKLEGLKANLVLMTSHVAQFFLEDQEWQAMLTATYNALKTDGHLVFDSRPPLFPPYQHLPTKHHPQRVQDANLGPIDWYYKLLKITGNKVQYQLHFHFININQKVISTDQLIFRSQDEIINSLEKAGFEIKVIYGDWDRSAPTPVSTEMIFVARKQ